VSDHSSLRSRMKPIPEPPPLTRRRFLARGAGTAAAALATPALARAASADSPLRFGVLADVQYADVAPRGSRHYAASLGKLRACVDALEEQDLAFVVQVGDLIDRDWESFDPVLAELDRLEAPLHHVLGNHDYSVPREKRPGVADRLGLERNYYAFDAGPAWRFLVLNGNAVSTFANPPGSEAHAAAETMLQELGEADVPNDRPWNGGIDDAQLAWLERELAAADEEGRGVVLFCHYPVAPSGAHNLLNDRAVRERVLAHPSARAWLNGHNHAGDLAEIDGVPFVTLHGMVETADTTAWATVELAEGRMVIDGRGREPDRTLALRG